MNILGALASTIFFLSPITDDTQTPGDTSADPKPAQVINVTDTDQDGNGWQ